MKVEELIEVRKKFFSQYAPYSLTYYKNFKFKRLNKILFTGRAGRGKNHTVNDCIIMIDTETSKTMVNPFNDGKYIAVDNIIVAWSISIRAFNQNLVTLYGYKPSEIIEAIDLIIHNLNGHETIFYIHNLSYDWVFLRKFMFQKYGYPDKQLNTKPHYPILIQWDNENFMISLKDSLILAQRSLEKWAKDLNVDHSKATGLWDYDKLRTQYHTMNEDELTYIECDTLAGVECIDTLKGILNKKLYAMPYTATGIVREEVRKIGKSNRARDNFLSMALDYDQYIKATKVFHGGFTHANRYIIDTLLEGVEAYDFSSSYPFVMLSEKYPLEKFIPISNKSIDYILKHAPDYAFMLKLILIRPRLKDKFYPMPALQFSKCEKIINAVVDNGRILYADYLEIYLNEIDLKVISEQYTFDHHICTQVEAAGKDYLPRWFTDYIFSLYQDKTNLKDGDPVLYAIAKGKINSVYGMCVQKSIKEEIREDYVSGNYILLEQDPSGLYENYLQNHNTILPYQWGVWVTSYAFRNLFTLGSCCEHWVYSDTDSCYGQKWDYEKIVAYNNECIRKLQANGYGGVEHNGEIYYLGVAEFDGSYSEFKTLGAKRYCTRNANSGDLKITVAGVPKKNGVKCLNNDINNFTKGLIFKGTITGKLTHTYITVPDIFIDEDGNERGDSIDLIPCDYLLDSINVVHWEDLEEEEIEIQVYSEEEENG